jgi:hypothetical protein
MVFAEIWSVVGELMGSLESRRRVSMRRRNRGLVEDFHAAL